MGRFRTLTINEQLNYNQLYDIKKGIVFLKNSKNSKENINYKIDCGKFYYFNNYNTYYSIAKSYSHVNTDCIDCKDYPFNLSDGLNSEICYSEIFKDSDIKHPCLNLNLLNSEKCIEKGTLYPYGKFNNNKSGRVNYLHNKIYPFICNKLECKKYKYCKCPNAEDIHNKECKICINKKCCCVYTSGFPTTEKFFYEKVLEHGSNCNCDKCKFINHASQVNKEDIIESFSRFPINSRKKHVRKPKNLYIKDNSKKKNKNLYVKKK